VGEAATYGWLPLTAADATVWPRDLEAAARWAGQDLHTLVAPAPRLAEVVARAWQSWADTLAEPAVPGPEGRTAAGRWGLSPDAPVRLMVSAVEGGAAGRALLRTLEVFQDAATGGGNGEVLQGRLDEALSSAPVASHHVRVLLRASAPERTTEALRHHLVRLGHEVYELGEPPPAFAARVRWPRDVILAARAPATGHFVLLRGNGAARVIDFVAAATPRASVEALVRQAIERGSAPPPVPAATTFGTDFAGVALLELALATPEAMRRLEALAGASEPPLDVLIAASDLAVACAERWRILARLAPRVTFAWSKGGGITLEATQTQRALDATRSASGPFPLEGEAWSALPVSTAARWHRATFLAHLPEAERLPADPFTLWEEAGLCRAGHPALRVATVAAALPALDAASWVTALVPGDVALLGREPSFVGVGILGLSATRPPTPRVGLVSLVAAADLPAVSAALGPESVLTIGPTGPTAVQGAGETRLVYGRRAFSEGRELALLGFGHDAFERLEALVASPNENGDAPLARISVDAAGLSAATGFADDPEIRAVLTHWGQRRVRADLRVVGTELGLRYDVDVRADLDPEVPPR
jgi:hypothetical protein